MCVQVMSIKLIVLFNHWELKRVMYFELQKKPKNKFCVFFFFFAKKWKAVLIKSSVSHDSQGVVTPTITS